MKAIAYRAAIVAAVSALSVQAQINVESADLAPAGQWVACTISTAGVHTAVLVRKDDRFTVAVDGAEGPLFDQILPFDGRTLTLPKTPSTTNRIPVIFSDDGLHHAYIARSGDDYIVVKDGKEVSRGKASAKLQGLVLSAGGKRVCYIESDAPNSHRVITDGKAEAPLRDVPKIVFSADGTRYAYTARKPAEPRPSLFVDGQPAGYVGEEPQFTSDNKLVCISRAANGDHRLVVDGEVTVRARRIVKAYVAPVGNQILTVVGNDPKVGQHLLVSGQKVEGSECNAIRKVIFSPDGKRYAALCRTQEYTKSLNVTNIREYMLIDGKKGRLYNSIRDSADSSQDQQRMMWLGGGSMVPRHDTPGFSADSSTFVYIAATPPEEFVVVEDQPSEPFPYGRTRDPLISRDGKHIALLAMEDRSSATIVVNGKRQDFVGFFSSFSLSPDGTRYAYVRSLLNVDGVDQQLAIMSSAGYLFSPDSKHIAVVGQVPGTPQRGLFIDGQLAVPNATAVTRPVFTRDSQHLFWLENRPAPAGAIPENFVAVVDGRAAVRFKELINTKDNWEISPEGTLTFVARTGDSLKRYRVAAPRDTSVTAMVNEDGTGGAAPTIATAASRAASPEPPFVPPPASTQDIVANPAAPELPGTGIPSATTPPTVPTPARVPSLPTRTTNTMPGRVGETSRKVDQTVNDVQQTKTELEKAKSQIKSLWETIAPKKK